MCRPDSPRPLANGRSACYRAALVVVGLSWAASASAASVRVEPGPAPPGTPQFAHFQHESVNPCVRWTRAVGAAGLIVLQGLANPPGLPCPSMEQFVPLGALGSGQYTLEARIAATGALYALISFSIGGDPFPPQVALLPARPAADASVSVGLSLLNSFCSRLSFVSPPRVEGDRITVEGEVLFFPFLCPPSSWFEGFFFTMPALSPGLKTVEFVVESDVLASLSFTVAEPVATVFLGERFRVGLSWQDRAGVVQQAQATRLTEESAAFTFFDAANVEVVVKILDGRGVNGHFWVFAASMTDLPYTLTVTEYLGSYCDLAGSPLPVCPTRVYQGRAGVNRNVIDTRAFLSPP
jgi:hypothetical protein